MLNVSHLLTDGGSVLIEYDHGAGAADAHGVQGHGAEQARAVPGYAASARDVHGREVGFGSGPTPEHALANIAEVGDEVPARDPLF
jgi:hypothetical protein